MRGGSELSSDLQRRRALMLHFEPLKLTDSIPNSILPRECDAKSFLYGFGSGRTLREAPCKSAGTPESQEILTFRWWTLFLTVGSSRDWDFAGVIIARSLPVLAVANGWLAEEAESAPRRVKRHGNAGFPAKDRSLKAGRSPAARNQHDGIRLKRKKQ